MEVYFWVSSFGCLYPYQDYVFGNLFKFVVRKYTCTYTFGCLNISQDRSLFLERSKEEWGLSMSFASLLWRFQKVGGRFIGFHGFQASNTICDKL